MTRCCERDGGKYGDCHVHKPWTKDEIHEGLRRLQMRVEDHLLENHLPADHELHAVWKSIELLWRGEK